MIRFNNDYNRGAHPAILEALAATNGESYSGYGTDQWCQAAAEEIKKHLDRPQAAVHFLVGGTQVNFTAIAAALRPFQGVVCADSGHIHVHETGAVENTGHKILALPATDGKITARQIMEAGRSYVVSTVREHITQPKLVYISFPTEYGTVYTRQELEDIRSVCDVYGMYLFVDGARMAYGLAASDATLADFARLADMFTVGGTKCGALFGEALVIANPELQPDFRSYMKQNGAMLAKGWLLGLQFYTLFKDGLYFDIGRGAVEKAMRLRAACERKGIGFYIESPTNQQFVILENDVIRALEQKYCFEFESEIDDHRSCVRFCTSWASTEAEIAALMEDIDSL